ncbi:MAG: hypothetical protein KF901_14785 [Myxococcales bacterium]|nr:hypothetical protein [Myxococcales bacterium]
MRRTSTLATLVAVLALATSLQTVAFFERASACWFLRMPASTRPPCCDLATKTRFTAPGGDCCKHLVLDETTDARLVTADASVPLAPVVATRAAIPDLAAAPLRRTLPPPAARGPPPPRPFHPTRTTVLRV